MDTSFLDDINSDITSQGGNDVIAIYTCTSEKSIICGHVSW